MLRALTTAATGMIAQQNYLDVIANNVANVNTTGFKKSRIEFQDLLSQAQRTPGALMNQACAGASTRADGDILAFGV